MQHSFHMQLLSTQILGVVVKTYMMKLVAPPSVFKLSILSIILIRLYNHTIPSSKPVRLYSPCEYFQVKCSDFVNLVLGSYNHIYMTVTLYSPIKCFSQIISPVSKHKSLRHPMLANSIISYNKTSQLHTLDSIS